MDPPVKPGDDIFRTRATGSDFKPAPACCKPGVKPRDDTPLLPNTASAFPHPMAKWHVSRALDAARPLKHYRRTPVITGGQASAQNPPEVPYNNIQGITCLIYLHRSRGWR